ncbi:MAG: lipoyl synthase [Candidatus Omnitrophica bacterium]|nr:lipoyl synthase [Candidatus Omnitrophota bacterium]MBU4487564.1 lipoyl synthase [Candidatus Omnitrophota bacterium]
MPSWLLRPMPDSGAGKKISAYLKKKALESICENSRCPNIGECYSRGNVSFLILGRTCTRNCLFCALSNGSPEAVRHEEAGSIAEAVRDLGIRYVVITSVTRDDLSDGGTGHYLRVINAIKGLSPLTKIEALTPDFAGRKEAIEAVAASGIETFAHNMETIERLYSAVRPKSDYCRSLGVLAFAASLKKARIKSGFMLGLGEAEKEAFQLMEDIRATGCDFLTIGQYLRPKDSPLRAVEYIDPNRFESLKIAAYSMGFRSVASGPYIRSSYMAEALYGEGVS